MIRVREIGEARDVTVTIGEYVCLTLEWQASPLMEPVYWRPGDHHGSLMEAGIHPETGILLSLSIVLPGDGVEVRGGPDAFPERRGVQGHPLIDLAPWGRKVRLDEIVPFRLIVYEHSVSIWFVSPDEAESDLVSERVRFHLSAGGEFAGITVQGILETEIGRLRETLAWLAATAGVTSKPGDA